jgi:hypothetical protein
MLVFLFAACAHIPATWEVTPNAAVALPGAAVAVVMADKRCRGMADALTVEINRRSGLHVDPRSSTRLALSHCALDVKAEVDLTQLYPGLGSGLTGGVEHRDEVVRANGNVVLTVEIDSRPIATLGAKGQRIRRLSTSDSGRVQGRIAVLNGVIRDLAADLAQQLDPEPEVVRRRMYRNPDPGSARALHNQAVEAERAGDFGRALRLAKQAAGASPSIARDAYVDELQDRIRSSRYVERESR